jgi:hypothetical protein
MLDPAYNLAWITVKRRKPNKWFKRGTLYRRTLDVLRKETEPMTASQIDAAILAAEGIEASKADVQSIQHSLKNHEGKGVEIVGKARPAKWRLKGPPTEAVLIRGPQPARQPPS